MTLSLRRRSARVAWMLVALSFSASVRAQNSSASLDLGWLEEIRGERALAWVKDRNDETVRRLTEDPRFNKLVNQLEQVPPAASRLLGFTLRGGLVHQLLTDIEHPRGLWRSTSVGSMLAGRPEWRTILDAGALSAAEGTNWKLRFYSGEPVCLAPSFTLCMVGLSEGGSDAVILREFDTASGEFVRSGFATQTASRGWAAWLSGDELLIAADFGDGSMNAAGYPRVVKRWRRGQALADAETVFEAPRTALLGVAPVTAATAAGRYGLLTVGNGMFDWDLYQLDATGKPSLLPAPKGLNFPPIVGVIGNRLVLLTAADWEAGGIAVKAGSLISVDLGRPQGQRRPHQVRVLYEPSPGESIPSFFGAAVTAARVWFVVLREGTCHLYTASPSKGAWQLAAVETPPHRTVTLAAADPGWDLAVAKVEGFLNPPETVVLEGGRTAGAIARERELFDAQPYVVEQRKATSADGTPVPYFLVHRRDLEFNGKSPTLLYGYGGFSISLTPGYAGMFVGGDVLVPWFSAGGTLAVANIRGGGEFGSTWHSSALRERRQRSYDDFLAVAEDLISSKVTSPPYLGLKGESNGGLLVSVAATQRPDLFRAVVAGVPLTDMLRYHTLLAGSSWVPEYGSPDDPAMRPVLASYSPLNNVRSNVAYPEIFYYTSTADDRVHPAHARWMVAKLRALGNPALYFENTEGGHGGAATLGQSARLTAMQAVYLMQKLGLSPLEER